MSSLEQHLTEYLAVRRAMGYKLARAGKLLPQFTAWMAERDQSLITTELALGWATCPPATGSNWRHQRLSVVRGFATHLHAIDPVHEVPPADLLPWQQRRAVPYLYTDAEIVALMDSATVIPTPHRAATMRTLIGLLAVTGMRVGEAIRLDRGDIDIANRLLVVRDSKFGKSREVALRPSTITALQSYLARRDRPVPSEPTMAVFTSAAGTRLSYCNVHLAFKRIVAHAGLRPRSANCRPRPHDLRHTFAVNTLLDAYRSDENPAVRLPLLSTYLGHVHPGSTYWYLQASPELLALAGDRLERHLNLKGATR
ncbi:MAG TPA: tyrosine-type recombinase/integrase [Solirubrobacteraceae bacterium]|nr:tyrosine-type recombinase/integrase [Solirubrobacteraceae bacterium]